MTRPPSDHQPLEASADDISTPCLQSGYNWSHGEHELTGTKTVAESLDVDSTDRYVFEGELGAGGMGRVVAAWDSRLRRMVAVKEQARQHAHADADTYRFLREVRITARLDHPGIVSVFDAGRHDDGRLYYVMRLIRGRSLHDTLLDPLAAGSERHLLRHFLSACEAVAHAHERGVVHRDLKPSNIMIGPHGETQVVDWGLARVLDEEDHLTLRRDVQPTVASAPTVAGAILGTPAYMSPEQALGGRADRRSDVWSLGVTLYHLLSGSPPFEGDSSQKILASVIAREPLPLPASTAAELCAITQRAMQKEPEDRYSDAAELAKDLGAFLDGSRVHAHDYSAVELMRRAIHTWRRPLTVAVSLVLGLFVGTAQYSLSTQEAFDRATTAEQKTREALAKADLHLGQALLAQSLTASQAHARPEAEVLAAHAHRLSSDPEALGVLAGFGPIHPPELLAHHEAPPCQNLVLAERSPRMLCMDNGEVAMWQLDPLKELWRHPIESNGASIQGDTVIVSRGADSFARLDAHDGSMQSRVFAPPETHSPVISSEGDLIATGNSAGIFRFGWDGKARDEYLITEPQNTSWTASSDGDIWLFLSTGRTLRWRSDEAAPTPIGDGDYPLTRVTTTAWSAAEDRLFIGTLDGEVWALDPTDGRLLSGTRAAEGSVSDLAVHPDGRHVAVIGSRGGTRIWHVDTDILSPRLPGMAERGVRFDPTTGHLIRLGREIDVWRLPETPSVSVRRFEHGISSVDLHPDGTHVAASDGGGFAHLWRTEDGVVLGSHAIASEIVAKSVSFSADGQTTFAGASHGVGVHQFRVSDGAKLEILREPRFRTVKRLGHLSSGHLVVFGYGAGPFIYDVAEQDVLDHLVVPLATYADLAIPGSADYAAALRFDGTIDVITAADIPEVRTVIHEPEARAVAMDGAGTTLAIAFRSEIMLLDLPSEDVRHRIHVPDASILDIQLSDDGALLAAGLHDGTSHVWRTSDGSHALHLHGHNERVASVAFDRDANLLATGSWDHTTRIWDLSVIDRTSDELLEEVSRRWQLELEDALASRP